MTRAELSKILESWRTPAAGISGQWPRLISEADPVKFMSAFADAVAGGGDVFLCDPNWGEGERSQLATLLKARPGTGLISPELQVPGFRSQVSKPADCGWLMIPTGGSSGVLKFARHDQDSIASAVAGFRQHFGLARVNAVGVLPLHHVSGLMAWMRCTFSGGDYVALEWKAVEAGEWPALPAKPDGWVVSLVPTQLERLLRNAACHAWLRGFRAVLIGGAPASAELLDRAAAAGLGLAPGYGMTETLAMVTTLRPDEFFRGVRNSGTVLPHAEVRVGADGTVMVAGGSVFRGYFPSWATGREFSTGDLGRMDEHGHLTVLGRSDSVIISGGEKVNPSEVEAVLRATGAFSDVIVTGLPDAEWGRLVVAAYPATSRPDLAKVKAAADSLAPYKRPKRYLPLDDWPVNAQGKVNRARIEELCARRAIGS